MRQVSMAFLVVVLWTAMAESQQKKEAGSPRATTSSVGSKQEEVRGALASLRDCYLELEALESDDWEEVDPAADLVTIRASRLHTICFKARLRADAASAALFGLKLAALERQGAAQQLAEDAKKDKASFEGEVETYEELAKGWADYAEEIEDARTEIDGYGRTADALRDVQDRAVRGVEELRQSAKLGLNKVALERLRKLSRYLNGCQALLDIHRAGVEEKIKTLLPAKEEKEE